MKVISNTKQQKSNIRNKAFNKYQAVLKITHNISRGYIESFTQHNEDESLSQHRNNI